MSFAMWHTLFTRVKREWCCIEVTVFASRGLSYTILTKDLHLHHQTLKPLGMERRVANSHDKVGIAAPNGV